MTAKERKQIEVLRNYIERAIWKTMEIQTGDYRIVKVNTELIKIIDLIDSIN